MTARVEYIHGDYQIFVATCREDVNISYFWWESGGVEENLAHLGGHA